ncbi:hypothetical protein [Nonomuraea candida]|uniref:hypothetical protein n=1 Tax=Nonomuraea candida TaxID=359159 RepID=UPI0006947249|nr:hypothetical protein [Nonomuraea candida]
MNDLPYYTDDPLVDLKAHRLLLDLDPVASAQAGRDLKSGTCSCGTMTATPPWDDHAVFEQFDAHMADVQVDAHEVAAEELEQARRQERKAVVERWNATVPVGTPVRYWTGARHGVGKPSRTRTPAVVLSGHTPVVWVEGEGSCIALTHVQPIETEGDPS